MFKWTNSRVRGTSGQCHNCEDAIAFWVDYGALHDGTGRAGVFSATVLVKADDVIEMVLCRLDVDQMCCTRRKTGHHLSTAKGMCTIVVPLP